MSVANSLPLLQHFKKSCVSFRCNDTKIGCVKKARVIKDFIVCNICQLKEIYTAGVMEPLQKLNGAPQSI